MPAATFTKEAVFFGQLPLRILHADGNIELNASLQPTYYYHLKDHLGNVRAVVSPTVTNSLEVVQTTDYYPYGMSMSKNSNTTPYNKYKYNGKEEQEMPGKWLDYGARMYDAQLGRFFTVDIKAAEFAWQSPFVYADNNPVKFIDFFGMNADGYIINDKGYIEYLNNEGGDKYDVLYNKNYKPENRKDYDKSGDKTGIQLSKGTIQSKKEYKTPLEDAFGTKQDNITVTRYEVKSDEESLNLMTFLDKNTSVEFSNTLFKKGNTTVNLLLTSHEPGRVANSLYNKDKYLYQGYEVVRDDHIHPSGSPKRSGGDIGHASDLLKKSPLAKFRIFDSGAYYLYKP